MPATGPWRRAAAAGRVRLLGAIALAALSGLGASAMTAPAATAAPAATGARGGAASGNGNASQPAVPAVPAVPASASFVARPQIAAGLHGVRQACGTPTRPGQMACMALVSTRKTGVSADTTPPSGTSYGPADLQNAYGLASAAAASAGGETVAVVDAFNDPQASANLDAYRSAYGLGACDQSNKCLTVENEHGGTADLPKADSTGGWELEESLDLDMVSAICPKCSIILVEASSASIASLAIAERTASRSGAEAVSNSWGSGAEFTGENVYDPDFYAPGVAITAAGGDDGYGTQYPAASPYVTSVGGTTLSGSAGSWSQSAWAGSGSGCSQLEPKPSWQTADAASPGGCLNRTDNDVSADANPNPGVWVYDTVKDPSAGIASGWAAVGGTSVSTPIVAAAYALADVVAGGPGKALIAGSFPAAYPYQNSSAFTDITTGSNGTCEPARRYLCHAVTGYDGPTGVGAISGTAGLTGPPGGGLTVVGPGTQVYQAGASIRLQLNVQPGPDAPTLTATGMPGLAIGANQVLVGTAPSAAGVNRVTVTGTYDGQTGSASFDIVVVPKIKASHPAAGEIRLNGGAWCLTGARYSRSAGTAAVLERCAGRSAQKWALEPGGGTAGTGIVTIDGRCLTVRSGSANGAKAAIQGCTKNSARQAWTYQASGHLRNAATSTCLAVRGSAGAGRAVVVWSCSGGASAGWVLPAAPVLSAVSGRCLEDPGTSGKAGTLIKISGCSTSASEHWTAERNGTIEIAGKCLAVKGSSMLDGAQIELAKCSAAGAERWVRGPGGQLMNGGSGRCVADPGNSAATGTTLIQDDCYREPGEIWVIS